MTGAGRTGAEAPRIGEPAVDLVPRLGSGEWFHAVGDVASSIGTDRFHQKLVELLGVAIPHSASWIIRYSRVAPPDVIYTANVPADVVEFYAERCAPLDPFSAHWRLHEEPGVRTLASFKAGPRSAIDPRPYSALFKAAAGVEDELGMFFSTVGHSSLGMFLEREKGRFKEAEVSRAKLVFPVLDGFHKAHLGRLFDRLRFAGDATENELVSRPTLVRDRFGLEIFSNRGWREAASADPSILTAVDEAADQRAIRLDAQTLKIERFDQYFPLAPSGTMFVLIPNGESDPSDPEQPAPGSDAAAFGERLTARERDIFNLLLSGKTTGWIAQTLNISKGTIKNYKLRIYRKAGVTSERELFQSFGGGSKPI